MGFLNYLTVWRTPSDNKISRVHTKMKDQNRKVDILGELKLMLQNIHMENKTEMDPAATATINNISKLIKKKCELNQLHSMQLDCVMYRAKEHANTGKWSEIDTLRQIITVISYLRLLVLISMSPDDNNRTLDEGFIIIDNGLLFGKPLDEYPELLHQCADILKKYYTPDEQIITLHLSGEIEDFPTDLFGKSIDVLDCPSLVNFSQNYLKKSQPVVLKKCMEHWPAMSLWSDPNYFIQIAGARTVPVEIGAKYTDENWTQKIMTMKDFIYKYIIANNKDKGYLAQHQLFNQLPELRNDIKEPEYCCLAESDDGVDINAWFGPKGTVSPLHFDPKQNFLSQVVGEKLVILYGPDDSPNLYPHADNMSNTSHVDPKSPKFEDFPEFQKATPYSCILEPGDMLFIPKKWWHYVESRTISFSVSFWWI